MRSTVVDPLDGDDQEAGNEMRRIRLEAGLSIKELADLMRYGSPDDLRKMEAGKRTMTGPIKTILEFMRDEGIDPDNYLGEIEPEG